MKWWRVCDILLIGLVIIADQVSKYVILMQNWGEEPIEVLPFFNLVLHYNTGVGFSLFNSWQPWQLLLMASFLLLLVVVLYIKAKLDIEKKAFAMLFAGALANMIDRVHLRGVVDFLDFHINMYHWPAFNMADMAIVLACGLLIFSTNFKKLA